MSDFVQALVISGSIFAVMMISQYGRREYTWHKVLIPVVSVTAFGWAYLRDMPTSGNAIWLYLVAVVIGGVFAVLATVTTGMDRDATGKIHTSTGTGFVITWLVAMALRIGFVWAVTNIGTFRQQVGQFMFDHQLVEATIAPFFVLMALTTVLGRVVALKVRAARLTQPVTPALTVESVHV